MHRQIDQSKHAQSALFVVIIAVMMMMIASCSGNASQLPPAPGNYYDDGIAGGNAGQQAQSVAGEFKPASGIVDEMALSGDGDFSATGADQRDRVILKTAYLSLVVETADETIASISKMAEEMGGWVVTSSSNKVQTASGQDVSRGAITVRVPAARLDEAMTRIKSGGGSVESESISGQDVTQQYVDLKSRLTNLEAAEAQLREIMADARKTEDVLAVYNQLVSTRGEIETVRGQIQYFDESSAFSSITVDVTPKAIQEPIQIAGWSPGRTAQNAIAALINLLQGLADLVITVVIFGIPLLLVVGLPGWLIWRRIRRRAPKGVVTSTPPESQT